MVCGTQPPSTNRKFSNRPASTFRQRTSEGNLEFHHIGGCSGATSDKETYFVHSAAWLRGRVEMTTGTGECKSLSADCLTRQFLIQSSPLRLVLGCRPRGISFFLPRRAFAVRGNPSHEVRWMFIREYSVRSCSTTRPGPE